MRRSGAHDRSSADNTIQPEQQKGPVLMNTEIDRNFLPVQGLTGPARQRFTTE